MSTFKLLAIGIKLRDNTFIYTCCLQAFLVLIFYCSCTKRPAVATSGFKEYSNNNLGNINIASIRLTNGNIVSVDQVNGTDSVAIRVYGAKLNFISYKQYVFAYDCDLQDGKALSDGGFVLTGNNIDKTLFFLTKFDANGNMMWDSSYNYTFDGSGIRSCTATDMNILVSYGNADQGIYIAKVNSATGALMIKPIKITGTTDTLFSLYVTSMYERSDGIFISGYYRYYSTIDNSNEMGSLFCLKTQENGITQWFKYEPFPPYSQQLSGNPWMIGYTLAENASGPVMLSCTNSSLFNNASFDYFNGYFYNLFGKISVLAYDPVTGNRTDSATFGSGDVSGLPIIKPSGDGGYIVCATTNFFVNSFTAPTQIMLIKTDAKLNMQWQKIFNPAGNNYLVNGLIPLSDGYVITGQSSYIEDFKSRSGIFLMKTNLQGNLVD